MTEDTPTPSMSWIRRLRGILGAEDRETARVSSTLLLVILHGLSVVAAALLLGGSNLLVPGRLALGVGALALLLQFAASFLPTINRREFLVRQWAWTVFSGTLVLAMGVGAALQGVEGLFLAIGVWVSWLGLLRTSLALLRSDFINHRPAASLALTFGFIVIAGTGFLWLSPLTTVDGKGLNLVDALFTATSAVCVTGLEVTSTGESLSRFGQGVVLILIQIGGLGIMTFGTFFLLATGRRLGIQERELVSATLNAERQGSIRRIVFSVLIITLGAEALGVLALWPSFSDSNEPFFNAVFHSVSAFCNAGFSLFDDSFQGRSSSWGLNATLMLLVTVGGLGFIVVDSLFRRLRGASDGRRSSLSVHARVVLWSSLILTVVGAVGFYFLEADGVLSNQTTGERWMTSGFQSVSSRTAGFSSVDFGGEDQSEGLSSSTRVYLMGFMLIGASPGSTGGGMKTVTVVLLLASILALLRGSDSVNLFGRRIPDTLIKKAGAIVMIYGVVIFAAVFALSVTDRSFPVLDLAFEVVSAVGTVGFSVGISSSEEFSSAGKLILTVLMYLGRLGPLTIVLMATRTGPSAVVRYPEERVMIG